jgi:hypothetical protein
VAPYTINLHDECGDLRARRTLHLAHDDAAIDRAGRLDHPHEINVWQGDRLVAHFPSGRSPCIYHGGMKTHPGSSRIQAGLWALMQRIERYRYRAELAEERAATSSEVAARELQEIACQWRDLARESERLERPRQRVLKDNLLHSSIALAVVGGTIGVATIAAPDWIELVAKFDPDRDSGQFELAVTTVSTGIAMVTAFLAAFRYRQLLRRRERDDH